MGGRGRELKGGRRMPPGPWRTRRGRRNWRPGKPRITAETSCNLLRMWCRLLILFPTAFSNLNKNALLVELLIQAREKENKRVSSTTTANSKTGAASGLKLSFE
ncbi:unnamed protein product [Caretta caretta]